MKARYKDRSLSFHNDIHLTHVKHPTCIHAGIQIGIFCMDSTYINRNGEMAALLTTAGVVVGIYNEE
jgi:queuine/archaeosine tRNA-ribosyltransferase